MVVWLSSWALNFRMGVTKYYIFLRTSLKARFQNCHNDTDYQNKLLSIFYITRIAKIGFIVKRESGTFKVKFQLKRREGWKDSPEQINIATDEI